MNITHHRRARALSGGMWHDMKINTDNGEYHAFALVFDKGSKYGLNNGRISKLSIIDPHGSTCYEYDRGTVTPQQATTITLATVGYIINMFK